MENTNQIVLRAKEDKKALEDLIVSNKRYIINISSKITKKYITTDSDEWSIALSAFCEAVNAYTESKGNFYNFCELVIKRRLYDYKKRELKHYTEFSIDPNDFDCEPSENEENHIGHKIIASLSTNNDDSAKLEILAITDILSKYNFSFYDLASVSPKAEKTKKSCALAVSCMLNENGLLRDLRLYKLLPIKKISRISNVPQKILERHRKYIIAAVEILDGDFPIISEYLSFIRKEHKQ